MSDGETTSLARAIICRPLGPGRSVTMVGRREARSASDLKSGDPDRVPTPRDGLRRAPLACARRDFLRVTAFTRLPNQRSALLPQVARQSVQASDVLPRGAASFPAPEGLNARPRTSGRPGRAVDVHDAGLDALEE